MPDHAAALVRYAAFMGAHDILIKGKANKYTSLNGNMFRFLGKDGTLFLRLTKPQRLAHDAAFGTGPVLQHGAVMRGYVTVPETILHDGSIMQSLVQNALSNAQTLKPRPTRKK